MKRSDQDRLLRELLGDDALERVREATLAQGVATLRRRRRTRALVAGAGASLVLALSLAVVIYRGRERERVDGEPLAHARSHPLAQTSSSVKILTDDQLLALFPDRPVALIGAPGDQRLVFLDRPVTEAAAR